MPKSLKPKIIELYQNVQESWKLHNSAKDVFLGIKSALKAKNRIETRTQPLSNVYDIFVDQVEIQNIERRPTPSNLKYLSEEERKGITIFISYASEDRNFAKFLYRRLKEAGFRPWIDVSSIHAGEVWENAIQKALKECMFFIPCLSKNSVKKRGYLQREYKYALEKFKEFLDDDIYIIPIKIDSCDVPSGLDKFQWINFNPYSSIRSFNSKAGWDSIMTSLTTGVRRRNSGM